MKSCIVGMLLARSIIALLNDIFYGYYICHKQRVLLEFPNNLMRYNSALMHFSEKLHCENVVNMPYCICLCLLDTVQISTTTITSHSAFPRSDAHRDLQAENEHLRKDLL